MPKCWVSLSGVVRFIDRNYPRRVNNKLGRILHPLRYSSIVFRIINYSCMNQWQMNPKYLLRPRVKYLHFRWILVFAKRISSNYLCFWPFVDQSQIIIWLWCHVTWITQINIQLITQKQSDIIWYLAKY